MQKTSPRVVPNAFEWEVTYTSDGKRVAAKKLRIGAVVIWGLVIVGMLVAGHGLIAAPLSVRELWRWVRSLG